MSEDLQPNGMWTKIKHALFGAPKDIMDQSLFHKLSLIPILAWIGLGADGLSSSSYGPEEAFRVLGSHAYLSIFLGLATALTVFIISYAYSRIIEHFPHGGGGYIVASHMLGKKAGVVSGCALLVDYVLTITVSIVSCVDALFSYLPMGIHNYKVPTGCFFIVLLIILNIRGVKESIAVLAPIFATFVLTHLFMLLYGIFSHSADFVPIAQNVHTSMMSDVQTMGFFSLFLIFVHAYSLGGGTYTGIEAVSNGLQIMREPRVQTGKRTMVYMAVSLAFTAGALYICYVLLNVKPAEGKTLNSVLADTLYGHWSFGKVLALVTILSEGALLLVAAQTGFIDGPRVMANMAVDSWFPHRFAALSERLSMRNGVLLMGVAALALLVYTHGKISALIVMYSINVFLTFSLSELGMLRFYIKHRHAQHKWKQHVLVFSLALGLCLTILGITVFEKFTEGGWLTLIITTLVIVLCYVIRRHYDNVTNEMKKLDKLMAAMPTTGIINRDPLDPKQMTAIQLVTSFNGFGVHTFLSVVKNFPHMYKNFIFVSVAQVDSGSFKGSEEMQNLEESVRMNLKKYVELARSFGFPAEYWHETGVDVVESATKLCNNITKEFPRSTVFTGQLTFRLEKFYHKMLHNETAFAIQRRLQWSGVTTVILPIRVDV